MDFIRSKIDYNFEIRWPFEWTRILDISIFSDVHSLKAKEKGLEPFASNCFLFGSSTSEFLFYNSYFEVKVNGEFSLFQKTSKEPFSFIYDVTFIFFYEAPQKVSHCIETTFFVGFFLFRFSSCSLTFFSSSGIVKISLIWIGVSLYIDE